MIPWLDDCRVDFPDTDSALDEPNGLLAAGGNLDALTLIKAYRRGIFPWYQSPDPILWWSPSPRAMLKPDEVYISKSLKKYIRKHDLHISADRAFTDVMINCAKPRNYTDETWIDTAMLNAYTQLHEQGYAHSVEAWDGDELVAGLYGIAMGGAFFGESMFTNRSNASKLCFVSLAESLHQCGFSLIDCQVSSNHLYTLGAYEVDRLEFESLLKEAIQQNTGNPWLMLNEYN